MNPGSKIVLTGGPCAGKTTMAEVLSRSYQPTIVNEAPRRKNFQLWSQHPNFFHIQNKRSFRYKVSEVLSAVSGALGLEGANEKK
jgi:tRNA uridine 5-carbamoylmethylation protein Kti12